MKNQEKIANYFDKYGVSYCPKNLRITANITNIYR